MEGGSEAQQWPPRCPLALPRQQSGRQSCDTHLVPEADRKQSETTSPRKTPLSGSGKHDGHGFDVGAQRAARKGRALRCHADGGRGVVRSSPASKRRFSSCKRCKVSIHKHIKAIDGSKGGRACSYKPGRQL